MAHHETSEPVKITSTREVVFPRTVKPRPRAFVRESPHPRDATVFTERSTRPEPVWVDSEPEWLHADGEPISIDDAHVLFDQGKARLADPDTFMADLDAIHTTWRPGDYSTMTPDVCRPGFGTANAVCRLTGTYLDTCRALAAKEYRARRMETRQRYCDLVEELDAPAFLTVDQVAAIFQCSPQTIMRRAGRELPAVVKFGRLVRFRADAIARFAA